MDKTSREVQLEQAIRDVLVVIRPFSGTRFETDATWAKLYGRQLSSARTILEKAAN